MSILRNLSLKTTFSLVMCFSMVLSGCNGGGYSENGDSSPMIERWSVSQKGSIVEIAYGGGNDFPQYAALHVDSSYFRMNYGPSSGWGTSIILLPSFWENGIYYEGAPVSATWETDGPDLVISIAGTISSLSVEAEVRLMPPEQSSLSAEVVVDVEGSVVLDERPGEAFKPVMLSSMHISDDTWDAQLAYVDAEFIQIPESGWVIQPPVAGTVFGLMGGTSTWKTNAPTIEIRLPEAAQITGWVTSSDEPNDDNMGFWTASDEVIASWKYSVIAKP